MSRTNGKIADIKTEARDCFRSGNAREAESLYRKVATAEENDQEALQMLGTICWETKRPGEAEKYFKRVLRLNPDHHEVNYQLGCLYLAHQNHKQAIAYFERAIAHAPGFFEPWLMIGNICAWNGELAKAAASYGRAINIRPDESVPYSNLGNVLADQGLLAEASAAWRKALELDPDYTSAHSNLLLSMHYSPELDADSVTRAHIHWAERHADTFDNKSRYGNIRDPKRRLRVGYISTDLREHSVSYFMEPVLENHKREEFEVYLYSCSDKSDVTAQRLQSHTACAREITNLPDHVVVEQVREDKIDILVDLAGHTAGNRLLVLARRPAPVQVTYLGYPGTTGMKAVDYRLTDEWTDPPGLVEDRYTEELIRLPHGFLCYRPPSEAPEVGPVPAKSNGHVTFGSFNNVAKISEPALEAWAKILHSVEESRLMLKSKAFTDMATREMFIRRMIGKGIDRKRISFAGLTSKSEHMSIYGTVDIALDTFPYNGTTTTCDALWMGVPVVTLSGHSHAGRVSGSILSRLGMESLITPDVDGYVEAARRLASDPARLSVLRRRQRRKLADSVVCDGALITSDIERAYRDMWKRWCIHSDV